MILKYRIKKVGKERQGWRVEGERGEVAEPIRAGADYRCGEQDKSIHSGGTWMDIPEMLWAMRKQILRS